VSLPAAPAWTPTGQQPTFWPSFARRRGKPETRSGYESGVAFSHLSFRDSPPLECCWEGRPAYLSQATSYLNYTLYLPAPFYGFPCSCWRSLSKPVSFCIWTVEDVLMTAVPTNNAQEGDYPFRSTSFVIVQGGTPRNCWYCRQMHPTSGGSNRCSCQKLSEYVQRNPNMQEGDSAQTPHLVVYTP
jgi:hypothetical protein